MNISEIRFTFLQVECLASPLRALRPPNIPFEFLLSGPRYQLEFAEAIEGGSDCLPPWRDGFGKLFWRFYLYKVPPSAKDARRAMAPFYLPLRNKIAADWLRGKAGARAYLYPWGIGLVFDVSATGLFTLDEAVGLGFQAQRLGKYRIDINGAEKETGLKGLCDTLRTAVRSKAFGPDIAAGNASEMFSVVTILDADEGDAAEAVAEGSDLHRALDALARWNTLYKKTRPKDLNEARIEIKTSPEGHLLYGGPRGRCVWFPGNFVSQALYRRTLLCYHQNLTMASLQTESLCRLAKDAAEILQSGQSLAASSLAYQECSRLAAGALGRLYGGTFETYRSHSIRAQIGALYKDPVDTIRKYYAMDELK